MLVPLIDRPSSDDRHISLVYYKKDTEAEKKNKSSLRLPPILFYRTPNIYLCTSVLNVIACGNENLADNFFFRVLVKTIFCYSRFFRQFFDTRRMLRLLSNVEKFVDRQFIKTGKNSRDKRKGKNRLIYINITLTFKTDVHR